MSPPELLDMAARHGVTLRLAGETVKARPADALTPELLATLRRHKAEIRDYLRRSESRVGPWQPPGAVAPPRQCVRCHGGLTAGEPDGGPCSTCRWYFQNIEPRRIQ